MGVIRPALTPRCRVYSALSSCANPNTASPAPQSNGAGLWFDGNTAKVRLKASIRRRREKDSSSCCKPVLVSFVAAQFKIKCSIVFYFCWQKRHRPLSVAPILCRWFLRLQYPIMGGGLCSAVNVSQLKVMR